MGGFFSSSSDKFNSPPPSTDIETTSGMSPNKTKPKKNRPKLFTVNTKDGADKRGMYVNDF